MRNNAKSKDPCFSNMSGIYRVLMDNRRSVEAVIMSLFFKVDAFGEYIYI